MRRDSCDLVSEALGQDDGLSKMVLYQEDHTRLRDTHDFINDSFVGVGIELNAGYVLHAVIVVDS